MSKNSPETVISAEQLINVATQQGLPEIILTPQIKDTLDKVDTTLAIRAIIAACGQEFRFIQEELAPMAGGNKKAFEILTGRINELKQKATEAIFALYHDTKPVDIDLQADGITREEQNILSTTIEFGDVDSLKPEKLPFLKLLSPETLFQIQCQAMDVRIAWWTQEDRLSQENISPNSNHSLRNTLANSRLKQLKNQREQMVVEFGQAHPELFTAE